MNPKEEKKEIRTRFAPSPTGYLHVGGARTALFCYLFAKNRSGKFILRIEDTDQKRSTKESTEQVIESLRWMGLVWDEGPGVGGPHSPYFQSERLPIYRQFLERLLEKDSVYPCFCTDAELIEKKERARTLNIPNVYDRRCYHLSKDEAQNLIQKGVEHTYRFKVEDGRDVAFDDLVKGTVKFNASILGDFIVMKSDGFPTYNFAVVVDDILMKISHILRGDDHVSNTPKQILLFEALGAQVPTFGHLSTILGPDREKLSKRHGATSILDFKEKGYLREAFINFLALLGWSTGTEEEILSEEELVKRFSRSKFNKSAAVFDYAKLDYFNAHYLRHAPIEKILPLCKEAVKEFLKGEDAYLLEDEARLKRALVLCLDHCITLSDLKIYIKDFLISSYEIEEASSHYLHSARESLIPQAVSFFSKRSSFDLEEGEFKEFMNYCKEALSIKGKDFFKPMRVAVTGKEEGYDLEAFLKVISRSALIARLRKSL